MYENLYVLLYSSKYLLMQIDMYDCLIFKSMQFSLSASFFQVSLL